MLLQWYQRRENYFRLLPPHFLAVCLKIQFLAIYGHLSPLAPAHRRPLDPTSFIGKDVLKRGAVVMITMERKLLQAITTPFSHHLPENSIFGHFWPFFIIGAYICKTLDLISAFIDKNVITGCICNDIYGERATQVYCQPIFPPFAWKFNFRTFLAIFHHLCLLMGNPMTSSPL